MFTSKIAGEQQYVSYFLMKFAIKHECLQNNNIQEAFAFRFLVYRDIIVAW